jgi:deoxycytidine triphosphate deaminase
VTDQADIFGREASAVLTDAKVREMVDAGLLISKQTFDAAALESCSYDVRVGSWGVIGGSGQERDLTGDQGLELPPGGYAGLVSWERFRLPLDVFARLGAKRSYSYDGIILLTGSLVDPGYEGHLLFGVYNASQKRYVLRRGAKICSVVFERLPREVERKVSPQPDLAQGRIPDAFINKMANMEVLPWMQISDRVKQIEQITSDILDLKQRYQDVLEPIRELTKNVDRVSQDVDKLSERSSELREATSANAEQLRQVTASLATLTSQLGATAKTADRAQERAETTIDEIKDLSVKFGRFSMAVYVVWAVILLVIGAFLPDVLRRLFGG